MSRRVLADRISRSIDWVKQVENGILQPPKLPMLLAIGAAVGLADLAELTGSGHAVSVNLYAGEKHAALGDVQAAVTDFHRTRPGHAHNIEHLAERLRLAWEVRHASRSPHPARHHSAEPDSRYSGGGPHARPVVYWLASTSWLTSMWPARAYSQRDEDAAVLALLDKAQRTAAETTSFNGFAKELLLGLSKHPPARMARMCGSCVKRVGVAV